MFLKIFRSALKKNCFILAGIVVVGVLNLAKITDAAEKKIVQKKAELAWVQQSKGKFDINYAYFDGSSWQGDLVLSTGNPMNFVPATAKKQNNDTCLVWSAHSGKQYNLYYAIISDENELFGPTLIRTGLESNTTPTILIDSADTPWIAWSGNNGKNDEVYYSKYTGTKWEEPKRVHPVNDYPDISPKLMLSDNGAVLVEWTQLTSLKIQQDVVVLEEGRNNAYAVPLRASSLFNLQDEIFACVPSFPQSIDNLDMATLQLNCTENSYSIQSLGKALKKKK